MFDQYTRPNRTNRSVMWYTFLGLAVLVAVVVLVWGR